MKPSDDFQRLKYLTHMFRRAPLAFVIWLFGAVCMVHAASPDSTSLDYQIGFTNTVRPFLEEYCVGCHSGAKPKAHLDLSVYSSTETIVRDYSKWTIALEKLSAKEMPPEKA